MNVDMAKRLVDRRREAGLSQEALAAELGVSRQAVSKWERSESSPDTDNLIALAQLYGVSLDDLLFRDVDDGPQGEPEAAMPAPDAATPEPAAAAEPANEPAEAGSRAEASSEGVQAEAANGPEQTVGSPDEDHVRIGFDGIHVKSAEKGDAVRISWRDGVHVHDAGGGNEVHVGWDGVHVNDRHYDSWQDARAEWAEGHHCHHGSKSRAWRNWNLFPYPVLMALVYIVTCLLSGGWLQELALVLTIPVYYALGGLIFGKRICAFLGTLYGMAVMGWFFGMCLHGQPHPAWVALLTIPLVCGLFGGISHWWHGRKEALGS